LDFDIPSCFDIRHFILMNIGFVGVGRMGANMARRLKDRSASGGHVTAVYDSNRKAATGLAAELGCAAAQDLSEVTAESDAIFTVVTDDNAMREVFSQTGANSRVLETDGEDMQNREHSCFFSAAHAAKDSGIALELARSLSLDLPLARATKEQYDRMIAEGLGELDKSGIAELTFKDRHKHSGDRL
jgi:3-hydroxyisobutyrate dehydrogenase-like beta-hydroxyacid dehydrogenase